MRKPPRARVKTLALLAIPAAYVLQLFTAVLGSVGLLFTGSSDLVLMMLFANLLLWPAAWGIIVWFRRLTRRRHERLLLPPTQPRVTALSTRAFTYVAIGYTVVALFAGQGLAQWAMSFTSSSSTTTDALNATSPLVLLLSTVIIGPIAEEALYRGALYPILRSAFSAPLAIGITAALFGISHGSIAQAIITIPLGIAMAVLAERTGSFIVPALAHIGYNAIAVYAPQFLINILQSGWLALFSTLVFIAFSITLVVIKARRPAATTL